VDITFSEGVYGADNGTTGLSVDKLARTFSQNGGGASNVTISSVKRNDNTVEGSASALTGGETTVRVFLTITGTPIGVETIELKPANGSSIYDGAGNACAATQTTGVKTLRDHKGPTLVNAARTDNTHVTVTLSENCTNITSPRRRIRRARNPLARHDLRGGFDRARIDASHLVLTVQTWEFRRGKA